MSKEKQWFQIRLKIRDSDDEVKELNKKVNFEISWEGNRGVLNPDETRFYMDENGKKHSYRPSKGEVVRFEKNGKIYDILVKINEIRRGLFRDEVKETGGFFPVSGSDFTIERDSKAPRNLGEKGFYESDSSWKIRPTELKWGFPVLIGVVFFFLLLILFFLWRSSRT